MSRPEPNPRASWGIVRLKGQFHYVFLRCLPRWGPLMAAAVFAGSYFAQFGFVLSKLWSPMSKKLMVRSLISGAIFALVMGLWTWHRNESGSAEGAGESNTKKS